MGRSTLCESLVRLEYLLVAIHTYTVAPHAIKSHTVKKIQLLTICRFEEACGTPIDPTARHQL